jgi:hypothetical protein
MPKENKINFNRAEPTKTRKWSITYEEIGFSKILVVLD